MITNVELFDALRKVTAKREGSRYRMLMELYVLGTGTSQRHFVDTLNLRPATVSEQLDILIESGLVMKHIDMVDKRISIITLTDLGKQEAERMVKERETRLQTMFNRLSESEKDTLYSLLMRILQ